MQKINCCKYRHVTVGTTSKVDVSPRSPTPKYTKVRSSSLQVRLLWTLSLYKQHKLVIAISMQLQYVQKSLVPQQQSFRNFPVTRILDNSVRIVNVAFQLCRVFPSSKNRHAILLLTMHVLIEKSMAGVLHRFSRQVAATSETIVVKGTAAISPPGMFNNSDAK